MPTDQPDPVPSAARVRGHGGLAVMRCCGAHFACADRSLFAAVLAHRRPAIVTAARAISGLAEPGIVYPVLAALAADATVRALGIGGPPRRAAPLLAATGVGASRVCLGVHWPGDVAAGWLFAEIWRLLLLADRLSPAWPGPGRAGTRTTGTRTTGTRTTGTRTTGTRTAGIGTTGRG